MVVLTNRKQIQFIFIQGNKKNGLRFELIGLKPCDDNG